MRLNNSHVINELYQFNYKDINIHALDLDLTSFLDGLENWDDIFYYDNNLYILDSYVTGVNYKVNLETKEIVQLTYTFDSDVISNGYYQWSDSCGNHILIIEFPDDSETYNVHLLTLGEDIIDTPISIVSDKGYDIYDINPDILMTDVYNDDILYFSCITDAEGKLNDIMYKLDIKKGTIESMNISIEEAAKDLPGTFEFAYISHGRLKVVFRIDKYFVFYEYSETLNSFNEIDRIISTYTGYSCTYFKNNHIIMNYCLNEYIGILVYDLHTHEKYLTPRMANSLRDVWFIDEGMMADHDNDGHMYRLEKCDKAALDKKADKEDENLNTEDKTIVGAINEINSENESLQNQINELFQNVSSGKELIASAITDKGVDASEEETFQSLSEKINQIPVGPPGSNIIGYINENNDIYVSLTELESGTYTLKFEDYTGLLNEFDDIGTVEV